jgi:hypothetical protein
MNNKLQQFAELITEAQQAFLVTSKLDCEVNLANAVAHVHIGKKYARVDVGSSGKYMVEMSTGRIFGIKAYGVVHVGHYYGTLDTTDQYHWGGYTAVRKVS